MVAGVALFAPARRLFENRVGDFLGWIRSRFIWYRQPSSVRFPSAGSDVLASFGFEPSMQRWLVGVATVPVALLFAIGSFRSTTSP